MTKPNCRESKSAEFSDFHGPSPTIQPVFIFRCEFWQAIRANTNISAFFVFGPCPLSPVLDFRPFCFVGLSAF
jgi:hypothetical protein